MTDQLPKKLNKEPLIDAVFELRFVCNASASNVLPGFLFSKLDGDKTIERLPAADMPKPIRDSDPNLLFAPLVRLTWNNYIVSIGDRSLGVGCKLPYPGWSNFKSAILQIVGIVNEIKIIQTVQRFSMKYIDLIPSDDLQEQVSLINVSIVVGDHALDKESFSLRIEIPENDILHIVNIVSSAAAKLLDGSIRNGIIVETDTVSNVQDQQFGQWIGELPEKVETIHTLNKIMFFKCLRETTITSLEPLYG